MHSSSLCLVRYQKTSLHSFKPKKQICSAWKRSAMLRELQAWNHTCLLWLAPSNCIILSCKSFWKPHATHTSNATCVSNFEGCIMALEQHISIIELRGTDWVFGTGVLLIKLWLLFAMSCHLCVLCKTLCKTGVVCLRFKAEIGRTGFRTV